MLINDIEHFQTFYTDFITLLICGSKAKYKRWKKNT